MLEERPEHPDLDSTEASAAGEDESGAAVPPRAVRAGGTPHRVRGVSPIVQAAFLMSRSFMRF